MLARLSSPDDGLGHDRRKGAEEVVPKGGNPRYDQGKGITVIFVNYLLQVFSYVEGNNDGRKNGNDWNGLMEFALFI